MGMSDLREGDGYVLEFDDGQAELRIVTTPRNTERRGEVMVVTFEQSKVETKGDLDAVLIAARQLGITTRRRAAWYRCPQGYRMV